MTDTSKRQSKFILAFIIAAFLFVLGVSKATACSELMLQYKNHYFLARNFDWPYKYAFIVINPRGVLNKEDHPSQGKSLQWVSKYGSVTINMADGNNHVINQAVLSGINEKGFSASQLWLSESVYPEHPKKPILETGLWVKYFIDNAKTVNEAIRLASTVDVEPSMFGGEKVTVHLFIHDAKGGSAVMEYIEGKLVICHGANLPIPVLTNDTYAESVQYIKKYKDFGGDLPLPGGYESEARFVNAADFLKNLPTIENKQQAVAYGFNVLGYISEPPGSRWPTVWSFVYDYSDQILYYRDIDNQQIRFIRLNNFNFSKNQPVRILPINNALSGNVEKYFHKK